MTSIVSSIERSTSRVAVRVAEWTLRHAPSDRREWAQAMRAELDVIGSGWEQLRWALSALSLAFPAHHSAPDPTGGTMPTAPRPWIGPQARALTFNVAAFTAAWLVFGATASFARIDSWAALQVGVLAGSIVGLLMGLALRAEPMAYFLAGQVAFNVTELAFHRAFGIGTVQGFAAHMSVMTSGTLAACFAGALMKVSRAPAVAARFDARDLGSTVRTTICAVWRRSPALTHLLLAVAAVLIPEVVFNGLGIMTSSSLYRDAISHVAVLASALVGAAAGMAIEWRMARPGASSSSQSVAA